MNTVFISHANDDKERLAAYVFYLLARLDPAITIWLDRPEEMHPSLGRHPRVRAIDPGSDWLESILSACHSAQCVMVFWSARASEVDRSVMKREIDIARREGKCVPVCLDPREASKLPEGLQFDQVLDVSRFRDGTDDGQFDRAITMAQALAMRDSNAEHPAKPSFGGARDKENKVAKQAIEDKILHIGGDYVKGDKKTTQNQAGRDINIRTR
jgi:TIR domain